MHLWGGRSWGTRWGAGRELVHTHHCQVASVRRTSAMREVTGSCRVSSWRIAGLTRGLQAASPAALADQAWFLRCQQPLARCPVQATTCTLVCKPLYTPCHHWMDATMMATWACSSVGRLGRWMAASGAAQQGLPLRATLSLLLAPPAFGTCKAVAICMCS